MQSISLSVTLTLLTSVLFPAVQLQSSTSHLAESWKLNASSTSHLLTCHRPLEQTQPLYSRHNSFKTGWVAAPGWTLSLKAQHDAAFITRLCPWQPGDNPTAIATDNRQTQNRKYCYHIPLDINIKTVLWKCTTTYRHPCLRTITLSSLCVRGLRNLLSFQMTQVIL